MRSPYDDDPLGPARGCIWGMCFRCGNLVGDTDAHDAFHDKQDGIEQLSVTTATNLMATLNALVGDTDCAEEAVP